MLRLVPRLSTKAVIAAPAALASSSASYSTPTFDYRRLKRRSQWRVPEDENGDSFVVSTEPHLGEDIDLNWAINKYKVTPQKEAFRNLHLRAYQSLNGEIDKSGRIVMGAGSQEHSTVIVGEEASSEVMEKVKGVRRFLSSQPQLFVQDGAIGSGESSVITRSITNSPSVGLALSLMLQNVPLRNPFAFEDEFVTLVAHEPSAPTATTLLHPSERWAMVAGNASISHVIDAAAAIANHVLVSETDVLPLANSHVLQTSNGTGILLGHPNPVVCPELFSAQNNAWTSSGLIRSFNGVVTSDLSGGYVPTAGDVVEGGASASTVTTSHGKNAAPSLAHPTSVAFLVNDKKAPAISEVDAKKAGAHFQTLSAASVPGADASALTEKFAALVAANGVKVFAVNATKPAKEVSKSIIAAVNGGK